MEVSSFAAVALGLTFVGTCHAASVEAMLQVFTQCYSCITCSASVGHVDKLSQWLVACLDRCLVANLPLKTLLRCTPQMDREATGLQCWALQAWST